MAYSLITNTSVQGASNVTTPAVDTTGADLLILGISCDDAYSTTPTDSKGNTWTQGTSYTQGNVRVRLYYSVPTSVGTSHTFSASWAITGVMFMLAFSGALQTSPLDQQNGANSFNTSLACWSITPVENNELIISVYWINSSGIPISVNEWMTEVYEDDFDSGVAYGGAIAYKIQTASAAINPTWTRTNSNGQAATVASFKAAPVVSTRYKTWAVTGTITSAWFSTTILLISDE